MTLPNAVSTLSGPHEAKPDPDQVIARRVAAHMDGDFVVFLIGMRINKLWKLHKWLPVFRAMGRMLKELSARPDSGLLGFRHVGGLTFVQYWRSFEHLEAYARNPDQSHWPAWTAFSRRMKASRGDVGIWHETYLIPAGRYEAIYSGMPPFGLGKVGRLVDAAGARESARGRLSRTEAAPAG
jgi:fumigallin biosynthesis monooxygenase-like protein